MISHLIIKNDLQMPVLT